MMKHYQVHFLPDGKSVSIHHGATIVEAAGLVGIILSTPCGGIGRCGKCKVRLQHSGKDVLACQYAIEHDIEVLIPNSSRFFQQKILEHGTGHQVLPSPAVQKCFIAQPISNIEQIPVIIAQQYSINCSLDIRLEDDQGLTADYPNGITALLLPSIDSNMNNNTWSVVAMENGDTTDCLYGISVDIGTTTVVTQLINLKTTEAIVTVSTANPQAQYGSDVISRIGTAETKTGLESLHKTIITCLNSLIIEATEKSDIKPEHIYEAVIVGNTTMNHLLLRYPTHQLGQAPYTAHSIEPTNQTPESLSLQLHPRGNIYTPCNIAAFIGSDTVAAALACGMDSTNVLTLLVDIGTNGEIVLGTRDRLLAASCAAGPALEGAGIVCGSRAQTGAIERVLYDQDDIDVDVIGQTAPTTICGSGLIDAVAVLLDLEIIDPTGRFAESDELTGLFIPEKIKNRVIEHQNQPAFILAGDDNGEESVILTQKDVRQIQLAKAAIQAGIAFLLKQADSNADRIRQVFLAGAFGNYIRKENALRLGLLPKIALEKIHFVGNAAGSGARMMLVNDTIRRKSEQLARSIEYIEIAHQTDFQEVFSECLFFPET